MKKSLLILLIILSILLTGCISKEDLQRAQYKISDLEDKISDLEDEISDLENIIYDCNNQIEDAKLYAGENYEDMTEILENLEICN